MIALFHKQAIFGEISVVMADSATAGGNTVIVAHITT